MGARGVETISAIAVVHNQPVATSSDVGSKPSTLPPANASSEHAMLSAGEYGSSAKRDQRNGR